MIGIVQFALTATLQLFSVPIFINKLGMELYGIFSIVSVIGNLNLLINFGLNGALIVHLAQQGKCKESDHDIIVTQVIMLALITLFTTITILFSDFIIMNIFSIPNQYLNESKNLLRLLVCSNSLLLLGQTFTAIIDSKQETHITNICQFVYSLIYWGGMISVVTLEGNLKNVGMIALISAFIWLILIMIFAYRLWGNLEINGVLKNFKATAKKQLSYGSKIFISGLIGFMFEPLSKILLSNFIGLNAVALFEIGTKIRGQIVGIITKALYPIYPYIANTKKNKILKKRIFELSKNLQLITIALSIIITYTMPIILKLWLNQTNMQDTTIFVTIMTITQLLLLPPVLLIYQYLTATGMADKNILIQMSGVIVNTIFFFVLLDRFGMYTILTANILAYFSSYLICNYYQYKYLDAKLSKEWIYYLKLIIFGVACTSICALIRHYYPVSLWDLLIYPTVVTILFLFISRTLKLINKQEIELYFGSIPLLKNNLTALLIAR